jgi:putative ATPase
VAVAAQQATHFVGMPECGINLAEAVVYLATAPKSNSSYAALTRAREQVREGYDEPVPLQLRNPVTGLMKGMGYGEGYRYAHDYTGHFVEQQFLPDSLKGKRFYIPGDLGYEKTIAARLEQWWSARKANQPDT